MIVVSHGKDILNSTIDALTTSDILSYLKPSFSVAIKPNLVVAHPASDGATTHPEVVEGIIIFLRSYGIERIKIIESSWIGANTKRAFDVCGYTDLSEKYSVPLIDLKRDSSTKMTSDSYSIKVCNEALNTDFLINVPVLKAHGQTRLTCCMKNLKGCIPDSEKRRFHILGLNKPIAELNQIIKVGYNVVDGICGDLTFEEGGNPSEANRIIVGRDSFLIDSYCAKLIGYQPEEIGYLDYGMKIKLGEFYTEGSNVVEINTQEKSPSTVKGSRLAEKYRDMILEDAACSACYSSLMYALHRYGSKAKSLGPIHIGQGYKGKIKEGIGVGNCTCGFSTSVAGCPPNANSIYETLCNLSKQKK